MNYQPDHPDESLKTPYQPVWIFLVLSLLTFGLYTLFWFYRNWSLLRDRDGWDILPVPRAVFAIFFTHNLLESINDRAVAQGHSGGAPNWLATGYVATALLTNLASQTTPRELFPLFLIASPAWFLLPAVAQLNFVALKESPARRRSALTRSEATLLLVGGVFTLLAVLGALMPGNETPP